MTLNAGLTVRNPAHKLTSNAAWRRINNANKRPLPSQELFYRGRNHSHMCCPCRVAANQSSNPRRNRHRALVASIAS
jgi:hypothetical protein